jgi:hypothetical protein
LPQLSESSLFRLRFAYCNKRCFGVMARPIRGIRFGSLWSFPDTSRSSFSFPSSFEDRLGRLSVAIGVAGAGVAVALQDVLASIAGAFSIGFSRLYGAGDRVQIGDTRGDVIDIGLLRTTLIEVGNWVEQGLVQLAGSFASPTAWS